MRKLLLTLLSLACGLALSSCATGGKAVSRPVACPVLPPAPPSLMQPPQTGQKVRRELFEPPQKPTPKSEGSKTSSALTERETMRKLGSELAAMQRALSDWARGN